MQLGHALDTFTYEGDTDGTSVYSVKLEGREVMQVIANAADPDRVIRIAKPGAVIDGTAGQYAQRTNGQFTLTVKAVEDSEGSPLGVVSHVAPASIHSYVLPRLHILISRLYVPLA